MDRDKTDRMMDRAGREVLADRILRIDIAQASPDGKVCPINPDHGRMTVDGNGEALRCLFVTGRSDSNQSLKLCNGHEALSIGE